MRTLSLWQQIFIFSLWGLLDALVFCLMVRDIPERRHLRFERILSVLGLCAVYAVYRNLVHNIEIDSFLKWMTLVLWLEIFRRISWSKAVYIGGVYFLITDMGKMFAKDVLLTRILPAWNLNMSAFALSFLHMAAVVLFSFVISRIIRKPLINQGFDYEMAWYHRIIIIFPVISYIMVRMVEFSVYDGGQVNAEQLSSLAFSMAFCALLVIVGNESLCNIQIRRIEALNEKMLEKQKNQYLINNEMSQELYAAAHEVKHLMNTVDGVQNPDSIRESLRQIAVELNVLLSVPETGNTILDIILAEKMTICAKQQIPFLINTEPVSLNHISKLELCTIVSNSLDNAIEAVSRMPGSQKGEIEFRMGRKGEMIYLSVSNEYNGSAIRDGELPSTIKNNRDAHGYGMRNIQEAVSHCHGYLTYQGDGKEFTMQILFPFPPDKNAS